MLYPVARTPEEALHAPMGAAARAREAEAVAGEAATFVTETVGPAFATEGAARAACAAVGERSHLSVRPAVPDGAAPPPPARTALKDGRRWPSPPPSPDVHYRLSIAYWRVGGASPSRLPAPAAAARPSRRGRGDGLDPRALRALVETPLRAARPQRALDIGLFEVRTPEAPGRLIPDE